MVCRTLIAIASLLTILVPFTILVLEGHDPRADAMGLFIVMGIIGVIPLGAMLRLALRPQCDVQHSQ